MKEFLNKYKYLLLIFLISFIIFSPSLFMFFTNDDFFFLKISQAHNLSQFLNFFNLLKGPDGFGMYRPLTTQVFYFLSWKLFNLSPLPLHIISFLFFFEIIYLVYKLIFELIKDNEVALLSAFLYSVSATHFGQLYYLAAFQELGMTFFVLLSVLCFIYFLNTKKLITYYLSFITFLLALLSKETAVITPLLLGLIYLFQKYRKIEVLGLKKFFIFLTPFIICLFAYLLIRVLSYGFATGDTYVWDFSIKKLINTLFWYLLWALNVPESLVDFVGPGLKINPNLFLYWGKQIMPILISFIVQVLLLIVVLIKVLLEKSGKEIRERDWVSIFCIGWFLTGILPVVFLPEHKFSFYLTLPLIGLIFRIAYLLITSKVNNVFIGLFLLVWTVTSILTIRFTYDTNWITQSELISGRVYNFFKSEKSKYKGRTIAFIDTKEDLNVFWSPTSTIKTVLSDKNFFYVFFPNLADKIDYAGKGDVEIKSRQFLGY